MENTPTYKAHQKTIKALEVIIMTIKGGVMNTRQKRAHDLINKFCIKIGFEEIAQQQGEQQ